ncbi:uncharacterized protein LOC133863288 [Alnus glutinosa]|uniref:uncharacterized protein LOC133863288 n=1 Tax=Alnus glutinosa TaxID=3517 RepID=UPI002D766FAC|nr:uncharacterized protein LOC133863288 [Alnus glutinosa]
MWTSNGLSYVASGVSVPLYANKVTEEQKRLGFARVLIEIDVHSTCPKELIICRANGDIVTVGVVYSWLPPKCSTCGTFGHATYTCNKKEQKVWVPKKISNSPHKKVSLGAKPAFNRTISKPGIGPKPKSKKGEIRLSNSFDRLSQDGGFEEEDKPRTPTTFLQVFEKAMSDKGKGILEASPAGKGWKVINNYSKHCLGKIWICWDPGGVKIDVVNVHAQVITCSVTFLDSGGSWMISAVYGATHGLERRSLFKELTEVKVAMGRKPWLITGDFNVIRFLDEKWGKEGFSCYEKEFVDCIQNLEVDDIAYTGCFHTWTNKQIGADFVSKKLDRVLANGDWFATFSNTVVEFLERGVSDHSSALSTKTVLKIKNRECFGGLGLKVKQARANLESAQAEFIASRGSAECQVKERECLHLLTSLLSAEENFLKQKSRVKWLNLGDGNTAFFHNSVKARNSSNLIKMVKDEHGHSYHEFSEIKRLAISFYKNLLGHSSHVFTPEKAERVANLIKKKFSVGCVAKMEAPVTRIEIKDVVFSMNLSKAPGPDGFSAGFYQKAWAVVGDDLCEAILKFFSFGKLLKETNATILTLIPKKKNASYMSEYRPIACCNVVYKCITKILANRLIHGLDEVIGSNQGAFIPKRGIAENILLAQEVVCDYHKTNGVPRCTLKVDLMKAYDSLDWEYVLHCLKCFGAPSKFIYWIRACITSPSFTIALNGTLVGFFQGKKVLRQGNPISPYLFVLAMEGLTLLMEEAATSPQFGYHPKCAAVNLTHLCFADDLLVFSAASTSSVTTIIGALAEFEHISGLKANPSKSSIFIAGVAEDVKQSILNILQMLEGTLPVRYLGVPFITKRLTAIDCEALVNKITAWEGGLGIKRIEVWNKASMLNHIWNLFTKAGSLWVAWINVNRFKGRWYLLETFGHRIVHDSGFPLRSKVEVAIKNGEWNWPPACSDALVVIQSKLFEVGIGDTDLAVWNAKNGQYTCADAWDKLREVHPVVGWWKLVWKSVAALSVVKFLHGNNPRPEEDRVARSNWRCGLELSTEFLVNRWGWSFDALVVV